MQEPDHAIPGLLIDANNKFVLVAFSNETVGVFVQRLDMIPGVGDVERYCEMGLWVVVRRATGDNVSIFDPEYDGSFYQFTTAEEREAVQIAKEMALKVWPEWCPHLRAKYRPRHDFMPLASRLAEA